MNASVTAGAAASAPGPAITPGNAPVPRLAESAPAPDPAFGTAGVRVAAP